MPRHRPIHPRRRAPASPHDPYPSTYRAIAAAAGADPHATVLTGTGQRLDDADVLMRDGKIVAVGTALEAPADATRVDGTGKWVTPGIIDVHSHLGVYPSPGVSAHSDGNEMTAPITPNVWAEHSIWPQDPGFATALAGGITSLQVLPGSANLIGGRGVTLKNVPATTYQAMKFPGAPWGLKMACGENPKRVYGQKGGPSHAHGQRRRLPRGLHRRQRVHHQERPQEPEAEEAPLVGLANGNGADSEKDTGGKRDLKLDTLAGAINGDIQVHIHCYRADEMATMLDLAKEFGFKVAAFHHGVEAYKIADRLAAGRRVRRAVGRLVGLQDGSLRRHPGEHRAGRPPGQRLRDRAFGFRRRHPAPQPGSGEGDGACQAGRHRHSAGARDPLADRRTRPRRWASSTRPARWSRARWPTW